jgi:tripeptide aminopeptidase
VRVEGLAEKATIEFIVRDFTRDGLRANAARLRQVAESVLRRHPKARMEFEVAEQYRNMKEVLDQYPQVVQFAEEAYRRSNLEVRKQSIRGGTDGSRLSFMGLPCPNLFTGMQAIHSKKEWIGVRDMKKAVEVIVNLVQVWEQNS